MPSHGQILLSIERLIRVADTLLANFNFDWGKARADVPTPEGSQVDRQEWDEYLKQHLSPMLPPTGYLPGFLDKVKSLLADMGTPGEPSVRRVLRLQFPSDDEKRCIKSLRVLKAELVAVKDREFLGVDRDTNPQTSPVRADRERVQNPFLRRTRTGTSELGEKKSSGWRIQSSGSVTPPRKGNSDPVPNSKRFASV